MSFLQAEVSRDTKRRSKGTLSRFDSMIRESAPKHAQYYELAKRVVPIKGICTTATTVDSGDDGEEEDDNK